jgi:hypothetical protein
VVDLHSTTQVCKQVLKFVSRLDTIVVQCKSALALEDDCVAEMKDIKYSVFNAAFPCKHSWFSACFQFAIYVF